MAIRNPPVVIPWFLLTKKSMGTGCHFHSNNDTLTFVSNGIHLLPVALQEASVLLLALLCQWLSLRNCQKHAVPSYYSYDIT
jgi:hypothetical protein